jgi:EAL domain-containing protein (putative c-di-GMP-specific phosphodiesterase class I)
MAKSLGFKTIAEGVETLDQLNFLREKKCDEIQGYYFSKPVPAEVFANLLRNGGTL